MPNDPYVLTLRPTTGGDLDLTSLRGWTIADAQARFRRAGGGDVLSVRLEPGRGAGDGDATVAGQAASGPLAALAIEAEAQGSDDPAIERWARWLIEKLDAGGLIYQRQGEGWRLRSGKLHAESERRLGELDGWSADALAGQRVLLEHVDDPGDSGSELEQSLSKLAASGWNVDAKKDKGPPEVFFAAGDMPLARGEDWRADGAIDPRLASALAPLVAAVPPGEREGALPGDVAEVAGRLPALAVVGADADAALLDLRTVAKALRDAGGLDLPSGEPLAKVVVAERFTLRAAARTGGADSAAAVGAADANAIEAATAADTAEAAVDQAVASTNGSGPPPATAGDPGAAGDPGTAGDPGAPGTIGDPGATGDPGDPAAPLAAHGGDALRFALLHAAAPAKRFRGGDDVVGYAAAFLGELREFAATRLGGGTTAGTRIDAGDALRRRLAGWCDTAIARSAENHERLDLHRATRNAIELLARIRDFDARATEQHGEVAGADREAVGVALAVLAQLLAPLAPSAAGDLWQQAGRDGSPGDAGWPKPQREPAAA